MVVLLHKYKVGDEKADRENDGKTISEWTGR